MELRGLCISPAARRQHSVDSDSDRAILGSELRKVRVTHIMEAVAVSVAVLRGLEEKQAMLAAMWAGRGATGFGERSCIQ